MKLRELIVMVIEAIDAEVVKLDEAKHRLEDVLAEPWQLDPEQTALVKAHKLTVGRGQGFVSRWQEIDAYMTSQGRPLMAKDIAKALNLPQSTVSYWLSTKKKKGLVRMVGEKKWMLK